MLSIVLLPARVLHLSLSLSCVCVRRLLCSPSHRTKRDGSRHGIATPSVRATHTDTVLSSDRALDRHRCHTQRTVHPSWRGSLLDECIAAAAENQRPSTIAQVLTVNPSNDANASPASTAATQSAGDGSSRASDVHEVDCLPILRAAAAGTDRLSRCVFEDDRLTRRVCVCVRVCD